MPPLISGRPPPTSLSPSLRPPSTLKSAADKTEAPVACVYYLMQTHTSLERGVAATGSAVRPGGGKLTRRMCSQTSISARVFAAVAPDKSLGPSFFLFFLLCCSVLFCLQPNKRDDREAFCPRPPGPWLPPGTRRWIIGPILAAGSGGGGGWGRGGGRVAKDDANSIHKRGLPLITHAVALSGE